MATLEELIAKQNPESQQHVAAKAAEIHQPVVLNLLREKLQTSQTEMAAAMGVKQPTIAKIEQANNNPRFSALKRYITVLEEELNIDVTLPTGKKVSFNL